MINYITVFDFENRRVGFTKTTNLIKAPWNWKVYGYLASSLMFIIGFCMFLSAKRAEYMERKNAKQQVLYEMADLNSTDV